MKLYFYRIESCQRGCLERSHPDVPGLGFPERSRELVLLISSWIDWTFFLFFCRILSFSNLLLALYLSDVVRGILLLLLPESELWAFRILAVESLYSQVALKSTGSQPFWSSVPPVKYFFQPSTPRPVQGILVWNLLLIRSILHIIFNIHN